MLMRAVCIALGEAAMSAFHPVLLGFAAVLIFSSYQLLMEEEEQDDLSENSIVALASRWINASPKFDGDKFFTMVCSRSLCDRLIVFSTVVVL